MGEYDRKGRGMEYGTDKSKVVSLHFNPVMVTLTARGLRLHDLDDDRK